MGGVREAAQGHHAQLQPALAPTQSTLCWPARSSVGCRLGAAAGLLRSPVLARILPGPAGNRAAALEVPPHHARG